VDACGDGFGNDSTVQYSHYPRALVCTGTEVTTSDYESLAASDVSDLTRFTLTILYAKLRYCSTFTPSGVLFKRP
jgi:hypothetical protein